MSSWYVVHTRSNYENRCVNELKRKGLETYLPVFRELHQWKDRRKIVETPLFRSYAFVHFSDSALARLAVLRSEGVVKILGTENTPTPIPNEEIEVIQFILKKTAGRCQSHPLLREGAWVRVKRGALKDIEGRLIRVKNQTRLVVSVNLLSQSVSAEVDANDVQLLRAES